MITAGHHRYRKAAGFEIGVQAGTPLAQVTEYVAPASAVLCDGSAPVIEYVSSAPAIECVAPAPAVSFVVPSQQFPPVYTTTTVTNDDNSDMISLVYPQFSSTAVEPYAPRVVDSLLPLEEFTEPVYDQVHQEHVVASEMTENIAEIPVVQEQVIVGTRPERLVQGGLERAACPRSEAPLLSPVVMVQEAYCCVLPPARVAGAKGGGGEGAGTGEAGAPCLASRACAATLG